LRGSLADRLAGVIGTGLYSGYFPIFPGTVGSLGGIVVYIVLRSLNLISESYSAGWPLMLGIIFIAGGLSAGRCEKIFGHDDKRIVIDEIWGMLVTLFLVPATWGWILAGFLLFRVFDVIKPFPARRAERIGKGFGVMLDDGFAAVYANVLLHIYRALQG
jgi:phosphatidylglycerophosphatase A